MPAIILPSPALPIFVSLPASPLPENEPTALQPEVSWQST
jgi:hypothetical protein